MKPLSFPLVHVMIKDHSEKKHIHCDADDLLRNKTVVLFSVSGAWVPPLSNKKLLDWDNAYPQFAERNVDEIYCVSTNDSFVLDAWRDCHGIQNVKMMSDGNGDLCRLMQMLREDRDICLGERAEPFVVLCVDTQIICKFTEPPREHNTHGAVYGQTHPSVLLNWIDNGGDLP